MNKTKSEVVRELKKAVVLEREASTVVLNYLLEVEVRKLYLPEKTSLFEFCTDELGYSKYEADSRIRAMRLMKEFPAVEEEIETGKLSLTVAAQTQSAFRRESEKRKKSGAKPMSREDKQSVLSEMLECSTREADRLLASKFPDRPQPERVRPVSATETRYEFTAGERLNAKLETLKNRLAHRNYEGRLDVLIEQLADIALAQIDALVLRAPRVETEKPQARTRYIRKATHKKVWANFDQGCTFEVAGKPCGQKHGLQTDHVLEFSKSGTNAPENLRLMCGPHNRIRSNQLWNLERYADQCIDRQRAHGLEYLSSQSGEP